MPEIRQRILENMQNSPRHDRRRIVLAGHWLNSGPSVQY